LQSAKHSQVVDGAVHAEAATAEDVSVDHGRANVFVAEQLLNHADVVAGLEQVGGEGVTLRAVHLVRGLFQSHGDPGAGTAGALEVERK